MFYLKIKKATVVATKKIVAVTLMEFMITSSLMLIILFSLSYFYQNNYKNNNKLNTQLFLQQQAFQILNHLKPHIEHLSFQGLNRERNNYDLFKYKNNSVVLKKHCLIFFYDINQDGCVGKRRTKKSGCKNNFRNTTDNLAKELFGFKLENQEIYSIDISKKQNHCLFEQCKQLLHSCENHHWTKLTERDYFQVTNLTFSWLKENNIINVTLTLMKNTQTYSTNSYIYILNNEQTI